MNLDELGCYISLFVAVCLLVLTLVAVIGVSFRFTGWRAIIAMVLVVLLGAGLVFIAWVVGVVVCVL